MFLKLSFNTIKIERSYEHRYSDSTVTDSRDEWWGFGSMANGNIDHEGFNTIHDSVYTFVSCAM